MESSRASRIPRHASLVAVALVAWATVSSACSRRDGFGEDAPALLNDAGADAPCTERKCSRDLRSIVSACGDEATLEVCTDDRGCGNGACVEPCEAARLSKGSVGCSFWTLPPDDAGNAPGSCFVAMIANTWNRPVTLKAGLGASPLDVSRATYLATKAGESTTYAPLAGPIPPGEVALVFLAEQADAGAVAYFTRCPVGVTPAITTDPIRHGTSRTQAFHLETDAPVAAYSIFPYGGAESYVPSATLLLPVSSWDTGYVAVSTAHVTKDGQPGNENRTLQIVASEDATTVSMRPTVGIAGGAEVAGTLAGTPQTWTLSRGQVLQITQREDASGSPISADKPVGLFGGASCVNLPGELPYCDLTQQQIAPFAQWGNAYALVPFAPRIASLTGEAREVVPYSLVGAIDGTVLTWDPERPLGAPETLSAGQVATFFTTALVSVKSQDDRHPFHANVYMTGSGFNGGTGKPLAYGQVGPRTLGDPDFVNLVAADQFLDRYVFFADYTYPETTLTVVRRKTTRGFLPVTLSCGGEITGFAPLGTTGEFEYAWLHLTRGSIPQAFADGTCGYGRHEASSEGPFSVTIWGTGRDASYGYAGGTGSRPANSATLPPVR